MENSMRRRRQTHRADGSPLRMSLFFGLLVLATGVACASWTPDIHLKAMPLSLHLGEVSVNTWSVCLKDAAHAGGVDPALLEAIVTVESGNHPYVFGWFDSRGVRRVYRATSYTAAVTQLEALERQHIRFDVGLAQINSRNLQSLERRMGIAPVRALDPCTNLRLAGMILREQIAMHGSTWRAVAGYNGALAYVPRVQRVYCAHVADTSSCRHSRPLSELLCDPIPVAQTERYYRVFRTTA